MSYASVWSQMSDLTSRSGSALSRRSGYSTRGRILRAARLVAGRRRLPMYRSIRSRLQDTVLVSRTVHLNNLTGGNIFLGLGWSATNMWVNGVSSVAIPGASDITNMYEICRIKKVEVNIMINFNVADNTATNSAANGLPIVYTAFDPTDNNTPSITLLQQYSTVKIDMMGDSRVGNRIVRNCYPRLQQTQSGVTIVNPQNQWVETGTDIPYNGMKIAMDFLARQNSSMYYIIICKVIYECKLNK